VQAKKKMAEKKMLTETEAAAKCIARPIENASTWGAEQAKQASEILTGLFTTKQIDAATFGRVNARIGNHSALRQWAVKQGLLSSEVAEDALCKEVKRILAMDAAKMAEEYKDLV